MGLHCHSSVDVWESIGCSVAVALSQECLPKCAVAGLVSGAKMLVLSSFNVCVNLVLIILYGDVTVNTFWYYLGINVNCLFTD